MTIDELLEQVPHLSVGGVAKLAGYANGRQISVLRARGRTLPPERLFLLAKALRAMATTVEEIANAQAVHLRNRHG